MKTKILCLTRGGEASYPNQDGAISIAKERGQDMMFLYISNIEFLDHTAAPKTVNIEAELDELGEFMLVMAQERACSAGVTAYTLVQHGLFRKVLADVIGKYGIETVILGSSSEDAGTITEEYLQEVSSVIHLEYEVEFIILQEGEVIKTYHVETGEEEGNDDESKD